MYSRLRAQDRLSGASNCHRFQPRPFTRSTDESDSADQALTEQQDSSLQTSLKNTSRLGHNLENISVFSPKPAVVQPKLTVGAPDDQYEQEADRIADQVMNTSAPMSSVQRDAIEEDELQMKPAISLLVQRQEMASEEEELQAKPLASSVTTLIQREEMPEEEQVQMKSSGIPSLQREEMPEEEESVQMKPLLQRAAEGDATVSNDLQNRLSQSQGSGQALSNEVRAFMEPRFDADFSQVRVHTGHESVQMNRELSAQAFTHRNDIYFGSGKYDPGSSAGKHLLAHELTHVVQQTGHIQAKPGRKKGANSEEAKRIEELKANYKAAVDKGAWSEAAVLLNGFNTPDILEQLKQLSADQRKSLLSDAPEWVTRVREPLKLFPTEGKVEDDQFKQIKEQSLESEKGRVKELTTKYQDAVKSQEWSQVAVLLNGFSDEDISSMLRKLSKNQRVAIFYTAPEWVTRVKEAIAKLDKIASAAAIGDQEFEQIKQQYPDGITVAVYTKYDAAVSGASEFVRAGDEFAKNQGAIALNGGKIAIGGATPISELSEVTVAVQQIHLGLVEKFKQSQQPNSENAELPKFTKIKNLALFAHGEPYGAGLHHGNKFELKLENVKTFVSGLKSALVDGVNVQLFACSTGADRERIKSKGKGTASYEEWTEHEQGVHSGADSFAANLAQELGPESSVFGHTTVGHTTENYAARVFGKAAGSEGGLHLFDLMYKEAFIQEELSRLFPDKTDSERAALHDSLREEMWAHFKDSVSREAHRKQKDKRYSKPLGQEMFVNPTEAERMLHEDWQNNWISKNLSKVKPKSK